MNSREIRFLSVNKLLLVVQMGYISRNIDKQWTNKWVRVLNPVFRFTYLVWPFSMKFDWRRARLWSCGASKLHKLRMMNNKTKKIFHMIFVTTYSMCLDQDLVKIKPAFIYTRPYAFLYKSTQAVFSNIIRHHSEIYSLSEQIGRKPCCFTLILCLDCLCMRDLEEVNCIKKACCRIVSFE